MYATTIKNPEVAKAIAKGIVIDLLSNTKALEQAGYSSNYARTAGQKLIEDVRVQKEIAKLQAKLDKETDKNIANRAERQQFWTDVMKGEEDANMSDRLRASELLGKSEADFVERHQFEGFEGQRPSDTKAIEGSKERIKRITSKIIDSGPI